MTLKRSHGRYSNSLDMSRSEKIGDLFRDEIATIIQRNLRDPRLVKIISVNEVSVAKDLAYADVYVSSFETQDEDQKQELILSLNGASGFIRTILSKTHKMRSTPKLRFHYDDTYERVARLESLIAESSQK
uniref:Ribosome-binding factor A n=1 Tax=uncultured gamma proteobacterium HF0070_08D07 TaxID=710983 RepID=E0XRW3_9GAMM|nr:ribosome-binding factor a [uncultured gamma proteobacterium HF0070_08D07]